MDETKTEDIPGIDTDKLRAAVDYLIDPRFGESRTKKFRQWIQLPPSKRPRLQANAKCLQVLFALGAKSMSTLLFLLGRVDARRPEVADATEYQVGKGRRAQLAAMSASYRRRHKMLREIEELRLGRVLTPTEQQKLKEEAQARWNRRREAYIAGRPAGKTPQAANQEFSQILEQELTERLAKAKAEGPVKAESTTRKLSKGKVDALAKRVGH